MSRDGSALWLALRGRATPHRLRRQLWLVWALAAGLFLAGEGAIDGARVAMKTVGKDAAPNILTAQEISASLAGLDTDAADALLGNDKASQARARDAFEKRREKLTERLVDAARHITFGDAERQPIHTMHLGLGRYLEMIGESRSRKDQGDHAGAVRVYAAASDLLHQRVLGAAGQLDVANRVYLDHEYQAYKRSARLSALAVGAAGGLLTFALVLAQVFLARRTRRRLSLPLLGGTLVAFALTAYLVARLSGARHDLEVATERAFESIHLLSQARSLAYDADGDQARTLLGDRAEAHERERADKVQKLTSLPHVDAAALATRPPPPGYGGLFATMLANATFDGERRAIVEMIRAFEKYQARDDRIREAERAGDHGMALEMRSSARIDAVDIGRFDVELQAVVAIDRGQFDAIIDRGTVELARAAWLVPVASLVIAALALLGMRPRLREYAA